MDSCLPYPDMECPFRGKRVMTVVTSRVLPMASIMEQIGGTLLSSLNTDVRPLILRPDMRWFPGRARLADILWISLSRGSGIAASFTQCMETLLLACIRRHKARFSHKSHAYHPTFPLQYILYLSLLIYVTILIICSLSRFSWMVSSCL